VCKDSWIYLKINDLTQNTKAKLSYYKDNVLMGSIAFEVFFEKKNQHFVIPVNAQYNWYSGLVDEVSINLTDASPDITIEVSFFQQ
jgi:hypothetical protein